MRLIWSQLAKQRVLEIRAEIVKDNESAAARTIGKMRTAVKQVELHPHSGRPGRMAGTRELAVPRTPYIIAYQIVKNKVEILSVVHERQRWLQKF